MNKAIYAFIAVLLIAAAGAYYWWRQQDAQVVAPEVTPPPPVATTPAEPSIKYPIEAVAPAETRETPLTPESAEDRINRALIDLLGAEAVNHFLRVENFPTRLVATVDNLDRPFASPRLWPVQPTPGRFTVEQRGEATVSAAQNHARYAPFVTLVESVNTERAVALYVRSYPLLQSAYESLGYPGKYFNDRLVAIIDHLLGTPEPAEPPQLHLVEVKGESQPARPWVNYQYVDPALENLSSGRKILLRVGPEHRKRLKTKLSEIRARLVGAPR